MAASTSKKPSKPSLRAKGGSFTTNNHRFEPFSQRIARLKIDPIHRVGNSSLAASHPAGEFHFRVCLDHWKDLNSTKVFTDFHRIASPLCENLPQLLYHADTLYKLLSEYIGKRDILSEEPLLNLLAEFAHDLGSSFEKHFLEAVSLVSSVAATHDAPEVIEWSFTCLAWMFKFLARLLVPDLRPLLKILLPYLGNSRQKPYLNRFTAESMVYLIRKAALKYESNPRPLENAVSFLLGALADDQDGEARQSVSISVMTLFSEATAGIDHGLHSSGPSVFKCLLIQTCEATDKVPVDISIIKGTLINLIHKSNAKGILPVVRLVSNCCGEINASHPQQLPSLVELLLVLIATRKGSRIENWKACHENVTTVLDTLHKHLQVPHDLLTRVQVLIAQSIVASPMRELIPVLDIYMDAMLSEPFSKHFLFLAHLVADLDQDRFKDLLSSHLQRFIASHWQDDPAALCHFVQALQETEAVNTRHGIPFLSRVPSLWEDWMLQKLEADGRTLSEKALQETILDNFNLLSSPKLLRTRLLYILHRKVRLALAPGSHRNVEQEFAMGQALKAYVREAIKLAALDADLLDPLIEAAPNWHVHVLFLEGFADYLAATSESDGLTGERQGSLTRVVTENLLKPEQKLKLSSLELLKKTYNDADGPVQSALSTASEILNTPYSLDTVRQMSMMVRRLPALQKGIDQESIAYRIIPSLCLGILASNVPQLGGDVCQVVSTLCEEKVTEDLVASIVLSWVGTGPHVEPLVHSTRPGSKDSKSDEALTEFQCSNVERTEKAVSFRYFEYSNIDLSLVNTFEAKHRGTSKTCGSLRSVALRILNAVPNIAERRSKFVVPLLLSSIYYGANAPRKSSTQTEHGLDEGNSQVDSWTSLDRKAIIEVFSQFINPKALYRSSDVYQGFLHSLATGDIATQKLALKAIGAWKSPAVKPYQEELTHLADTAKCKDQLSTLFEDDKESSSVQEEHREELVPIILRVLYGQMLNKSGARGSRGDQEDKRKAILRTIFRLRKHEIQQFLSVAFGPLADIDIPQDLSTVKINLGQESLPRQQQHGLLNMVLSILETQKGQIATYGETLLNATLYCLLQSCWTSTAHDKNTTEQKNESDSLARRNKRIGLQCLNLLFKTCPHVDWERYLPLVFAELISPRLSDLPIETAQGISGLLQLFATWTSSSAYLVFLVDYEASLLDVLIDCVLVPSAQDSVKIFILDQIFNQLAKSLRPSLQELDHATVFASTEVSNDILLPHMDHILSQLSLMIEKTANPALLNSGVSTLCSLTAFATAPSVAEKILKIIPKLLAQSSRRVNIKTKTFLLLAMRNLLSIASVSIGSALQRTIFESVSVSFGYLKLHSSRSVLCEILTLIAESPVDAKAAEICTDLNAQSTVRLDSIDYDRRLGAFNTINEAASELIASDQWLPIVQNLMFFAKDAEDFAIRSNTIATLKHYIESDSSICNNSAVDLVRTVLIPAVKRGVKEKSEAIRADHVGLMGLLVSKRSDWPELSDMSNLLANNDEEASFFNNILHIQQHRRLRAIRRLIGEVEQGRLRSSNITSFFLPLLERFIFDQDDDERNHNLVGQSIEAIGILLKWVEWHQFRAVFLRFKSLMLSEDNAGKHTIRLVTTATDALHHAVSSKRQAEISNGDQSTVLEIVPRPRLSLSLPSVEKVAAEFMKHVIPDLATFVHHKDETELSLRIPVCLAVGKLAVVLDADQQGLVLPPLFLDIAYILRSRSQDSRDAARRTLGELVGILGPSCLSFVLRELRTALARGYQLHVLSYTVHSILVSNEQRLRPGDLDECLQLLVAVVIDDIFGIVGQEKDAEEYTSKMKEVKSSKSFDSMELLAKSITISHLIELIDPLRLLLTTNLNSKQSHQTDELFRRIGVGLMRNPAAAQRDLLIFTYQLIQKSYITYASTIKGSSPANAVKDQPVLASVAYTDKPLKDGNRVVPYKLTRFALDVIRSTLQKHEALCTAENVQGFVPIIGDALLQSYDEVKISALRLLSVIIKLPLQELDDSSKIFVMEAVKVIKESVSTSSETAQAALKLLAAYLRERKNVAISESDLAYLLQRIMPDLEEPDRQGVTFNFVKAVMARRFTLPEIYELMDKVAVMMVTNHSRNARDVARGAYVHFLLEYPQAKSRWAKQVKFLVKNLEYEHKEGRQSIMEAINTLLSKCQGEIAEDIIGALFVPLVLLMSNDESENCREMAAALLGLFLEKSGEERSKVLMSPIRSWIQQHENLALTITGIQVYNVFFDTSNVSKRSEITFVRSSLFDTIRTQAVIEDETSWEPTYHALQLLSKLCASDPQMILHKDFEDEWSRIGTLLRHVHPWVQAVAAGLFGKLFHDLARSNTKGGLGSLPLIGSGGLRFDEATMIDVLHSSLLVLQKNRINKNLSSQTVQNLIFVGRCVKDNKVAMSAAKGPVQSLLEDSDESGSEGSEELALHHLFHQSALILRAETSSYNAAGFLPRISALNLLTGLCYHTDVELLKPCLQDLLLPLQHLTDPSTAAPSSLNEEFQNSYKALVAGSHELLDSLQKKLGSTEYIVQMSEAQKTIRERREDRRTKRRIDAVANPEKYGKDKRKKADRKKMRNKEKSMEFRGRRRGW